MVAFLFGFKYIFYKFYKMGIYNSIRILLIVLEATCLNIYLREY